MIRDKREFNAIDSLDAKTLIKLLQELIFDPNARGKRVNDTTFVKHLCDIKALVASGVNTIFL